MGICRETGVDFLDINYNSSYLLATDLSEKHALEPMPMAGTLNPEGTPLIRRIAPLHSRA